MKIISEGGNVFEAAVDPIYFTGRSQAKRDLEAKREWVKGLYDEAPTPLPSRQVRRRQAYLAVKRTSRQVPR